LAGKLTVEAFADSVSGALGRRLVSLLLYGSAASGAHVPQRSDVNTLLICDAVDEGLFDALTPVVRDWRRAGHPAPLIFTEREWGESADAFPIEYGDMRQYHRVLAGPDPLDSTTSPEPVGDPEATLERGVAGLRVGFLAEAQVEGLDAEVSTNLDRTREAFRDAGARVSDVAVPRAPAAIAIYYVVASAEASSNLARFDGVRYGPRKDESSLLSLYVESRTAGFGPAVKRRILLGTFALSAGYYEAYYGRAMRARQLLLEDFERAFDEVDVIVCPTIPTPAFRLGEKVDDPLTMYLSDVFTVPASLAGLPAISVPSGLSRQNLPLGIQIMARRFGEETLFAAARAFERQVDFPDDLPPGVQSL